MNFEIIEAQLNKPRVRGTYVSTVYDISLPRERRRMKLTNVTVTNVLIDPIDFDLNQFKWHVGGKNDCIQRSTYNPKTQRTGKEKLHRIIGERIYNRKLERWEEIDHENGNPFDNRRSNLRLSSHHQNQCNQRSHGGTSKYVGVSHVGNKWVAHIMLDSKGFYIGSFNYEDEAAWMRDQWAIALHKGFARLNFEYVPVHLQTNEAGLIEAAIEGAL